LVTFQGLTYESSGPTRHACRASSSEPISSTAVLIASAGVRSGGQRRPRLVVAVRGGRGPDPLAVMSSHGSSASLRAPDPRHGESIWTPFAASEGFWYARRFPVQIVGDVPEPSSANFAAAPAGGSRTR